MWPPNVYYLGVKELRSLLRDTILLVMIVYSFTVSIYAAATAIPENLNRATIAIVDEDRSQLSARITDVFYLPYFMPPELITLSQMDQRMDAGLDTFALVIPPYFQRDVLAGRKPEIQLNVDATRMSQAFTGTAYVQAIVSGEVNSFLEGYRKQDAPSVDLVIRSRFNPQLNGGWFSSVMEVINNVTLLSIVLAGAALIREREHGTVEHLLVMPVTPLEILVAKVWSMGLVVLIACAFALVVIVQGLLEVPLYGSLTLFFGGTALLLFSTTSMGILLATLARSMPQFALLVIMVILPLELLSGGSTPRESMPDFVQNIMLAAPTTHFVSLAQSVLFRGAGIETVWPALLALLILGGLFFVIALLRLRQSLR